MKRTAYTLGPFRQTNKRLFGRKTAQRRRGSLPALERMEERVLLAASFFAPAAPAGNVNVQLDPLANVTPGAQEIVTFGVPFTRGSVGVSQLSQVRVLKNGVEIPAFVELLTPWRSIDDPAIDGQSVRVARIQIPYTFTTLSPETINVQWGGPARTLNRPTMQDPRLEWHTVTSGSFVAADNVEEPDVLPVLPGAYLSQGMLDARTDPTNSSVAETRDNPAAMDSATFSGYTEFDSAEKNFFYTIINQNGSTPIDYKTQAEPWLYDRSSGMYDLYFRSGFATALREAIRSTDFYVDHLDASGYFTLKAGSDPKYSYNEALAYTYWLLGDNRMLAPISTVVSAFNGTATHWTPTLSFWTERNSGDKLLATEMAYEVTGSATFKNSVQTIVGDFVYLQNGANGQLPSNRVDGGLYHYGVQHDLSEVSSGTVLIASSWMSVMIVDPMVRVFGVWQNNSQVPDFIIRMGNFEKYASKFDADGQFGGITRYPDYLMRPDGVPDNRSSTDVQHAMDVGSVAAWATYFAELRGTPDLSLRQLANDLYATYDIGVNFWTSSSAGYPVTPPRRYTWEYKNSASFSWALTATDPPAQPGMLRFNATDYSVVENQGSATITVTRASGSTGSVSVSYATSNGTATAGSDYAATSGTLTFADGEASKSFSVPIINDSAVENRETVILTLSNPTGGAALDSPATATLSIDSDDSTGSPITLTFQQGVNGYAGTTDVDISNQNGGNGSTTVNGNQLGVYQLTGANGYTIEGLIRFGALGITTHGATDATITAATLTLTVDTFAASPTIRGYYLLAPWTTAPGTDLGWLRRGTGQEWASPGAGGQGTDVVAGKSFVLSGISGTGAQTITVNLDPAVVQSWIDNPNADQGILLVNETTGAVVRIDASENATAALRPKLSVSYTVANPTFPGSLQFSNSTYSVNENGGTATVTVTRTGGTGLGSVSVNYATSDGTATAGSDYTATSGTLTFAAGQTTSTFTIPIIDDNLVENNESINLVLSNPSGGAALGSQSTATLTIIDADVAQPGALQFGNATYSAIENGGAATITVTRTGGSNVPVTVHYATSDGTATGGSDYTASSGTLSFAIGETSKTFAVPISNDALVEGNETVALTLSSPTGGATLGSQISATLTIVDDDTTGTIAGSFQQGLNGYTGTTDASITTQNAQFTGGNGLTNLNGSTMGLYQTTGANAYLVEDLIRFGNLGIPVGAAVSGATLTLSLSSFTANPTIRGYYVNASWNGASGSNLGWLHRGMGQDWASPGALGQGTDLVAGKSFVLSGITGNGGQVITVNLDPAVVQSWINDPNADQGILLVNESPGAIVNVDASESATVAARPKLGVNYTTASPGSLQFSAATYNGNENGSAVTITVTRTGGSAGSASVNYATGNGSATAGSDYAAASGTLTFADGETSKTFTVPILNDTLVEGDEVVNLTLSSPTGGATLGSQATATLTIADDDIAQPGVLQFSTPAYTVNEPQGTATITVIRTGGSNVPVSVNYATSNGTATAGSDYTASAGTLNFAVGETSKTFTVPILDDSAVEGDETVNLTLSSPTGGAGLGSPTIASLTIVSDDLAAPGVLQFSAAAYTVNEPQGTATITVIRTGGSNVPVSVGYATSNGTATAGSDYTASSGILTFAVGETSKTFTVPILDDTAVENAESVSLILSNPIGGATLGTPATATLTINSDDTSGQPTTVTLQQGLNGYTGTTDASISTQYALYNGGNGITTVGGNQLGVYQLTGTSGYAVEDLIRFSNLGIPSNATVSSAALTLSVENWSATATLRGYYLLAPWSVMPGSNSSQLGWLHRGTGQDWATPGALGQGSDVVAGKSFVMPGITATGAQLITVSLDPAVVQSWINNPSADQGILLVNETTGAVVRVNTAENTTAALRPKLSVSFTVGTTTPQPGTLQFGNASYSVNENGGTATVTVTRTGGSAGGVTVNFATSNGTAAAGSDYTGASGTLTFADGDTSKSFTIPIINDTLVEADETVNLTLSSPTGGASLGTQTAATLTIVSDDVAQPGVLQFSTGAYTVNEPQGTATITVIRTGGSNVPVSVAYATSNGTATAGSDYTAIAGTLNFAIGETSKTFTVPIIDDTNIEGDETVNLTLSSPTGGASLGTQTTATLTIASDDVAQPGVLQFSTGAYTVNEPQGTATITVIRIGGSSVPVSVNYATSNGTATAASDYTASSGTLTFAVGETSKTFTVPIIDDSAIENPETVNLTLSGPTGGATLGSQATAILTINSDDAQSGAVTFQQGVNGYAGTTDVSITTQNAQFTGGNGLTTANGTQMGLYQTMGSGSYVVEDLIRFSDLGIPAGATVSSASLTLNLYTFFTTATPTLRGYYVLAPWSGTPGPDSSQVGWIHRGTGQDWVNAGALGQGTDLVAGKNFVLSGITNTGSQNVTVNLDPAVVQTWVNDPSAAQGILLVNETPGAIVQVSASENTTVASRPKLSVSYTVGAPTPGTLQFSNATYAVNESGGTATIAVTRTGGSTGVVSVNYATSNGTATAGSDYTTTSGILTFANGETSKTITVPITNDTTLEGNETINLTLSNPTGGANLGSQTTAVLTIQDDDVAGQPGALQFSASSYSLTENGGALTVTVTRAGGTNGAVTVHFATSDGTATAGSDYTAAGGTLSFASGEASKTFTVMVLDDTAVEGNETVTLALSNPTGGATLGSPASASFTIVDDDSSPGVVLPAGFTQSVVANGLSSATSLTVAPDGRVFVLEQGGAVRVIKNGALLATPALTVTTDNEEERGLLSLAFDPNFAANQFIYVSYTVGGPQPIPAHNRISRFTLNGDVAVASSEVILYELPVTTFRIHNSSTLKFGADGKLYISVGNDNTFGNSQDMTNPFGKILRINSDGTIPTDNPFYNQTTGNNRAIWAIGLRNPYTFDVQPGTGLMYINDVGEAAWEEIDRGVAGANYGWPNSEGYTTNLLYQSPVYAYPHGTGPEQGFAIVGAAFYNPATTTFPSQYVGKYFFMDYVNGWIEYVDPTAPNPKTPTDFALNIPVRYDGGPVDLEVGSDGALYYLNRLGGGVFKIQYSAAAQAPSITQQPANQTVTQGQPVTFTVAASSVSPITYQWQKMDSGATAWVNISGATSASYTISSTAAANNGDQFRAVVSNGVGSTNSNPATLTVTAVTASPALGAHTVSFVPFNSPPGALSTNPITTQASGSTVLAWLGRGKISTFTSATVPTDTKGNTSIQLGSTHDYSPLFPDSGMAVYSFPSFAGGGGDTFTVPMPLQDEVTLMVVEIKNGGLIQDSQWNKVVNAPQTSLSVTTTGPATLVSFWTGDASASSVSVVPNNGFTMIDSQFLANNAIEAAVATKDVAAAGTYNVTWTATPSQVSYIWLIAVQHGNPVPQPGTLQLSSSSYSVNESQGTASVTVTRTGGSDGAVAVNYSTSNGTATAGSDYTAASGTLTFAAGETSKTITVPIIDDSAVESNETVNLTLTNPTGGATLGTPASATLTIVDNDTAPPAGTFTKVNVSSGIDAIIAQKYQEDPNWWLSGEHLIDLDNDGDLDLFLDAHNGTSVVALNDGHGVFTRVTTGSWPSTEIHEMYDINGDGKVDINATFQDGGSQWWINHSSPGVVNFTPTSVTREGNTSREQVLFDFNGDGKVDWFRSAPPGLVVDFGDGNGGFAQGSLSFPIPGTTSNENANFLPGDFDGDGKIDLLVLTGGGYDGTLGRTGLWHNNGNMTFTDITASAGIPTDGTVVKGVGDFDQDGDIDLIATENKTMPPVVYINNGQGLFTKKLGAISGVPAGSLDYAAWGTAVTTDFDNDGIADIIMDGKYYLKVLRGTGGGNFTYMNTAWGITDTAASAVDDGLTFGDIDGDGDLDIIGYNETFPTRTLNVYRNDLASQNWLNVRPVGLAGNTGAAGATISVYATGTTQLLWYEQVAQYDFQVATSYYGYDETERHFGLGSRTRVDVVVRFPSGRVTRINNVAANQTIQVLESAGA